MDVLTLEASKGLTLADKHCFEAGTLNMVVGRQAKDLLDSAEEVIKQLMDDDLGCPYTVIDSKGYQIEDKDNLASIWKYMRDKPRCVEALYNLLGSISRDFKEVAVDVNGDFYFHCKHHKFREFTDFKDMDDMSASFKNTLKAALKAFIPSNGVVVIHDIEQVGSDNHKALIEYLTVMTVMRDNRTVMSTQSMDAVKAYNSVMLDNSGLDSVMVVVVGNTPDNCDILKQAKVEAELFNNMLGGVMDL